MIRLDCPRCGCPLERDDDRVYDDQCFEPGCGWATDYRRQRNAENARRFAEIRGESDVLPLGLGSHYGIDDVLP